MSFNTSNISCDNVFGNVSLSAPSHLVGLVELTENSGSLNVNAVSLQADLVESRLLVSSESITTPLLIGDLGFPITVQNLETVTLESGAGTAGQVLGLDSSLNLVWKDDSSSQGLEQVLTENNDANGLDIVNLKTLENQANRITKGVDATFNYTLRYDDTTEGLFVEPSVALGADGSIRIVNTDCPIISASNITGANVLQSNKVSRFDVWVSNNGVSSSAETFQSNVSNTFTTIQDAINYVENLVSSNNTYYYINVLGGAYTENLTITKKMFLMGKGKSTFSATVGCSINGTITINVDSNGSDMFNNLVSLSGLLINGKVNFQSSANSMLSLENCYIYTPNNTDGMGLLFSPSSTTSRLKLWQTQIISGGANGLNPLVLISAGSSLVMNYCYLSAKGVQNCLKFEGASTCDNITNCKLENSNSSASLPALVQFQNTNSALFAFSNVGFIYNSTTNKSASAFSSGIQNASVSGNNTLIVSYCQFFLAGTTNANFAVQDSQNGTASQMNILYYMNGASLNNAFAIRGTLNTNKFQLLVVS